MIHKLLIKNYAIIEELEIEFSEHLTIITGETGAGKSILLGAFGLIMGNRADSKVFYDDSKKCVVEGTFTVGKYDLKGFFEEHDIDYDTEVVVRRELTPSGKSRSFVNDTPVKLKVLQQLTCSLVDLHQQFDNLDIHNISFQLRMIDALADNSRLLESYKAEYRGYVKERRELETLIKRNQESSREFDYVSFLLEEFREVELIPGEQTTIEGELARLSSAEDIKRNLGAAYHQLVDSEHAIIGQLEEVSHALIPLRDVDESLKSVHQRFESILLELQDICGEFERIAEHTEYDGARIAELQLRLDHIYKLQNKHHVKTLDELLEVQAGLEEKLNGYSDLSNKIEQLELSIDNRVEKLRKQAIKLSERRRKVIPSFEKKVHEMLGQLSMQHARLKVEMNEMEELCPTGFDEVQFMFSANKGGRFLPVKDVASGGELSRLTLCTKSLVASAIPLPSLIFDEIDTGISGDVAMKMGVILQHLSRKHQVISITHSPQIAVKADAHYFIYKSHGKERTVTRVKQLGQEERVQEIAAMLSGNPPTNSAIENARELLGG